MERISLEGGKWPYRCSTCGHVEYRYPGRGRQGTGILRRCGHKIKGRYNTVCGGPLVMEPRAITSDGVVHVWDGATDRPKPEEQS